MARSDTPAFYCLGTDITLQKVEFLHFYNSATLPSRKIKLKTFQIFLPRPDTTPSLLSHSLNISWMLTNREEYLANGLWLTLVTVLVTESHSLQSDTDVSRNTRSVLVPGPGHNYPHSQDRGKPRSECVFFIFRPRVIFIKHCPMTAGGWLIEIWGWIPFCPILHGSQPGCERPVSDFVWWSHVILPDGFYLIEKAWLPSKYNFPLTQSPLPGRGALLCKE